ncbi:hypothetical protein ACQJBY_009186 [Aegilops geniculata]
MDLPKELLDQVLGHVPPRHLAACRCVCKSWRAVVDGRGLLRAYLAPRPLRGIFINFFHKQGHSFFSRDAQPQTTPRIPISSMIRVLDHQNGLVLYTCRDAMHACNPATRRWATVPPPPVPFFYNHMHLMFDPTVSLHYDVLCFPNVPKRPAPPYQSPKRHCKEGSSWTRVYTFRDFEKLPPSLKTEYRDEVNTLGCMEWPPHLYAVQVFSSGTGQWQERHFIRQGNAAVTVADVWSDRHARHGPSALRRNAVYWRGAFYLHCYVDFIVRLSLQDGKYAVIKTPTCDQKSNGYFGKSKQRIYYTAVSGYQISVWVLQEASETCQTLEWALRHQNDLEHDFQRHYNRRLLGDEIGKSWTLDPCMEESSDKGDNGWDSSDDSVTEALEEGINGNEGYKNCYYGMDFLGYHPDKEIVFLGSHYSGFAYYLGTSKLHYLGSLYPNSGLPHRSLAAPTLGSFIYTPCVEDLLPAYNNP